jgi:two-component system, NtrC family, response regulator AtoC
MSPNAFKLESLLETHDSPFVIIDADLQIVAVNRAWENSFELSRQTIIGQPCCLDGNNCRHKRLFDSLEPYSGIFPFRYINEKEQLLNVRGYPLLDADSTLYLGESSQLISKSDYHFNGEKMIGKSAEFMQLKSRLRQAADTSAPVMLLGETGTGKELAAEYLHCHSRQAKNQFIIVDCTLFSEELFESELFGHEKGAFTGAVNSKKGLFELADGGTLFLDEIGELPLSQQPKLLRALESGQFRRVGGSTVQKSNVRIISATHRNLAEMVKQGSFREDLFYRLSVFPIQLPALRERKEDLPVLIDHFLSHFSESRQYICSVSKPALIKLIQHNWPGNIRELRNCLQLASGICKNHLIQDSDINFIQRQPHYEMADIPNLLGNEADQSKTLTGLDRFEADFISSLIAKYHGNRKLIAAEMNISERTLYRKLNRLNLN